MARRRLQRITLTTARSQPASAGHQAFGSRRDLVGCHRHLRERRGELTTTFPAKPQSMARRVAPTRSPHSGGLKATISDQTAFMAWPNGASVRGETHRRRSWVKQFLRRPDRLVSRSRFTPAMSGSSSPTRAIRKRLPSGMTASCSESQCTRPRNSLLNGTTIANNAFNGSCGQGTGCSNETFQVIWVGAKYGITKDLDMIGAYYHYIQNQFVNGPFMAAQIGRPRLCQNGRPIAMRGLI